MRTSNVRRTFRNRRGGVVDHGERRRRRRQDDPCGDQIIEAPRAGFARRKIGHRQVVARVVDVLGLRLGRAAAAVMLAAGIRIRRAQAERQPLKSRHRKKEQRHEKPQPSRGLFQQAFSFPAKKHWATVPRNRPHMQPKLSKAYFLGSAVSLGFAWTDLFREWERNQASGGAGAPPALMRARLFETSERARAPAVPTCPLRQGPPVSLR